MKLSLCIHSWFVARCRDERGVVLAMALVVIALLMGIGSTALFSGYTNLLTSTNLRIATQARAMAEAGVNEALYRLSRQETDPAVIVPDLTNSAWQVEIDFTSGDSNATDGTVSTIQPSADWPEDIPDQPVIVRFKRPDPIGAPSQVLFYDPTQNPPFVTYTLPGTVSENAHPVMQILSTALDDRDAERQMLAEVTTATAFAPPAPLSSGVDVNLNGSGFIDGVNHDHRIFITSDSGTGGIYGDGNSETTDTPLTASPIKDSPDDNVNDTGGFFNVTIQAYPAGDGGGGGGGCESGVGNPQLNTPTSAAAYRSCARLFDKQISAADTTPAWVGLQWIANPAATGCTALGHSTNPHWHGTNTGYASAVALSNNGVGGPTVTNDQPPTSNVWTKGVFTWRNNNKNDAGSFPGSTSLTGEIPAPGTTTPDCSLNGTPSPTGVAGAPTLVCRPVPLSHGADSFNSGPHFPYFQEFLGLDDASFQALLDRPDTTKADLDAGEPPLGFTYIEGDYTFNNSTASPGNNDFGLLYVTGSLTINGNQTFKGLIFIDGSLSVSGNPTILGAIMVRGTTQITAGTGNMTLLYSREAAELGIQAAHPWRILSWQDTEMQQ